jgi:hypothetical protein
VQLEVGVSTGTGTCRWLGHSATSRENLVSHSTKPYTVAISLTKSFHDALITIAKELTNSSTLGLLQRDFLGSLPAQLQHGPKRGLISSRNGSRTKEITCNHVASRHSMVHKLLLHVPVHVTVVGSSDDRCFILIGGLDSNREFDVVCTLVIIGVSDVGKRSGVMLHRSSRG